jgi:serine/threonine-protein phosphatase PGAM5
MKRWWVVLAFTLLVPTVGACAEHVRTLYLVRHGAYVQDPKADPQVGPSLTPLGIAQARLVAARLEGMPIHFDAMTSSTLARARETAAVIHESLTDVPLDASLLLSECTPPASRPLRGQTEKDLAECAKQLDAVFSKRFVPSADADRNELLVCHGNVIRYLVLKALRQDPKGWLSMTVAHASLTVVRVQADGSMSVLAVGDVGHIPPNMVSWGTPADAQLVTPK